MPSTKTEIRSYFQETLAIDVAPQIWQPGRRLPLFLREGYTFYEIELLAHRCLLMADKEPDRSAAVTRKHIAQVQPKWDGDIICVREKASSDERRRLIEQKIPFVVPGNQMYLPTLGIDFREHFRQLHDKSEVFSPASQAAILLLLTDTTGRSYTAQELADRLGYSKMTASRTLNDLISAKVDAVAVDGRTRKLQFDGNRRELWERALPYLGSPVKQTWYMRSLSDPPKGPNAGLTALANYSMLSAPPIRTVALTNDEWKQFESRYGNVVAKSTDPDATEIEVWSYDPKPFAKNDCVDQFSLFLCRKDDPDERVQIAVEEMMENLAW